MDRPRTFGASEAQHATSRRYEWGVREQIDRLIGGECDAYGLLIARRVVTHTMTGDRSARHDADR